MKTAVIALAAFAAALSAAATTAQAESQAQLRLGKRVYDRWCIDCHGAGEGFAGLGLTGTAALEEKYQGAVPALLEERRNLTPEFVAHFVRHGVSVMPFFRRTEISDAELTALGAYLARHKDAQPAAADRK